MFDNSSYDNILADPPEDFVEDMEFFRRYAEHGLELLHCGVSFKRFSPASLQALFVQGEDAMFSETMDDNSFSGFFEGFDFGEAEEKENRNMLYLNSENSFVQSLGQVQDEAFARNIIQVIYIQSLLAGHYTLGSAEMEMMNKSLQWLMEYALYGER